MWIPNNETRIELINNIEGFECNDNVMAIMGLLTMPVFDLVTFYTNEHGHKILVVHSYTGGTLQQAKEFFTNFFVDTETIIFSTSSCDLLRPVIKQFAEQNSCELQYKINIHIDIESDSDCGESYLTSGSGSDNEMSDDGNEADNEL